jgi:hypothetical protein
MRCRNVSIRATLLPDLVSRWFVDVGEDVQLRLGRTSFVVEWKRTYGSKRAYFDRS